LDPKRKRKNGPVIWRVMRQGR